MSFRHVAAVLDHYPHGDARKLVLIAIAEQANEGTWVCWPSFERLGARACISDRQARRIVDKLKAEGVLEVNSRRGRGATNVYRLRLDVLKNMPTLLDVDTPISDPSGNFSPIDEASEETGHHVLLKPVDNVRPLTSLNRTPCPIGADIAVSLKQDIAMSYEPEGTGRDRSSCGEEPVDNHSVAAFGALTESLASRWGRPSSRHSETSADVSCGSPLTDPEAPASPKAAPLASGSLEAVAR